MNTLISHDDRRGPVPGADTRSILERLLQCSVGDVISYRDLTSLIGRDVQIHRHILTSACLIAQREHNRVFVCIRNVGVRRLDDIEVVDYVPIYARKARNAAARGEAKLDTVDYDLLPRDKQTALSAYRAVSRTLQHFGREKTAAIILDKIQSEESALDLDKTLRLFLESK